MKRRQKPLLNFYTLQMVSTRLKLVPTSGKSTPAPTTHLSSEKFPIEVLTAFVNYIDFTDFELDNALRYFLNKFRLPGEAQKIDRIMQIFATKFCNDNPSVFNNQGTNRHHIFPSRTLFSNFFVAFFLGDGK